VVRNPESMNPDTLVAVSAYAGDLNQVLHNLPYYLHHRCQLVILSPTDAPIERIDHPGVICMQVGKRGWIGPQTLERHRLFLETLLKFPHKHFLFHDADSICLSPRLPKFLYDRPDVIWSNEVTDTNPAPSKLPKLALQPPYFFSRRTIEGCLNAAKNLPTSYYAGAAGHGELPVPTECIDHYQLQLAEGSSFEHKNFYTGASFETKSDLGRNEMINMVRNHGRNLIHSVKTKEVLDLLLSAHRDWARNHGGDFLS
jgi:hypothetical protein